MSGKDDKADKGEAAGPPDVQSDADASKATMSIEALRKFLSEKLSLTTKEETEPVCKVLEEATLDGIVKHIVEKNCTNIITLAGAGISTSAGIPDFRSPGSGLYHNLQKYELPHPHAIFELSFFRTNPKPFFILAKELYPGAFRPTPSHYFVKLLHEKGVLLRHYTQNIDTLERVAGIPAEKLMEAHGTFHTSHCLECKQQYDLEWMKERIFHDEIPKCATKDCEGTVKPDIVFFGERLPSKFFTLPEVDFDKCDLLIVMGSSLAVQPFASLIDRVPETCPRLLINREKAGCRSSVWSFLGTGGGMDFSSETNRDVAWLGDCDDGCQLLADKLGWGEEFKKLCAESLQELIQKDKQQETTKDEEREVEKKEEAKKEEETSALKSSI